jgi:DNA primase
LVEAGLAVLGKKYARRGDKITAQCPAHDDRNPSFSATIGRDGGVLFHCHAGCSGAEIMDALGLRWDQIKPDDYRAERHRKRPRSPSYDELVIAIAESDRRQGKRLTGRDLDTYRAALRRQHEQGKGAA